MLRPKSILILAVVAVVLIAAAILSREKPPAVSIDNELLLPDLMAKINTVQTIKIKSAKNEFSVQKMENGWGIDQKDGYLADTEIVRGLLLGMARTIRLEPKTKNPELYEKLQLQDVDKENAKSVLVGLFDKSGAPLASLVVGKSQTAKADRAQREYYVRLGDSPQSWLVQSNFELEKDAARWLQQEVLRLDESRIRSATVSHDDGSVVVVRRDTSSETNFTLVDIPADKKIKYEFAVNDVAKSFSNLDLEDVVKAGNIDFSGARTAVMQSFDGMQITLETAVKDDITYARLRAQFDPALIDENQSTANVANEENTNVEGENVTVPEALVQAALKSVDEVQNEVEVLNTRWSGWAYQLPDFELNNIFKPLGELLEDIEQSNGEEESTEGNTAPQN